MSKKKLIRFGVSLNLNLLADFDYLIRAEKYKNRSQAIADLIKERLISSKWKRADKQVAAVVSLVYNHHQRALVNKIVNVQHDFQKLIISTQHIHLDHDNCLEIIATKGKVKEIINLTHRLRAIKGIKHASLTTTTSGRDFS